MNIRRWASKALFKLAGAVAPAPDPVAFTPVVEPRQHKHTGNNRIENALHDIRLLRQAQGLTCKGITQGEVSDELFNAWRQSEFPDSHQSWWKGRKRVLPLDETRYAWMMPASAQAILDVIEVCLARFNAEG